MSEKDYKSVTSSLDNLADSLHAIMRAIVALDKRLTLLEARQDRRERE